MSQEEIEALMSGADEIQIDDTEEETADIEQTDSPLVEAKDAEEILSGIDGVVYDEDTQSSDNEDEKTEEELNIDDILANIEGITDDADPEPEEISEPQAPIENKEDSNQYPMPVSNENKVVNQLNEVADDSEEKASQIFDVLSFILDENGKVTDYNNQMAEFLSKQLALLESLSVKFPNVETFNENLNEAKVFMETSKKLGATIESENNKVFEAMELMQYHDINRQKIERVMAVIKKLSTYLNGLFEDESGKAEIQIAKHISGDSNETVSGDDIEALISKFSQ